MNIIFLPENSDGSGIISFIDISPKMPNSQNINTNANIKKYTV